VDRAVFHGYLEAGRGIAFKSGDVQAQVVGLEPDNAGDETGDGPFLDGAGHAVLQSLPGGVLGLFEDKLFVAHVQVQAFHLRLLDVEHRKLVDVARRQQQFLRIRAAHDKRRARVADAGV